jgi:tetratricopeptide (TPR) repeat protein
MGDAHVALRGFDEAAHAYRDALGENASNAMAHAALGNLALRRGELDETRHHLRIAHRLGPRDVEPIIALAELACQEEDPATARQWIDTARTNCPDLTVGQSSLVASIEFSCLDDVQSAIKTVTDARDRFAFPSQAQAPYRYWQLLELQRLYGVFTFVEGDLDLCLKNTSAYLDGFGDLVEAGLSESVSAENAFFVLGSAHMKRGLLDVAWSNLSAAAQQSKDPTLANFKLQLLASTAQAELPANGLYRESPSVLFGELNWALGIVESVELLGGGRFLDHVDRLYLRHKPIPIEQLDKTTFRVLETPNSQ